MARKRNTPIHRQAAVRKIIRLALQEDIGTGDVTAEAVVPERLHVSAEIVLKEPDAVVCGLPLIQLFFSRLDPDIRVKLLVKEGSRVRTPRPLVRLQGQARAILQAERTILNLLSRLSGIATATQRLVQAVKPYRAQIYDTRKTTPGLRVLEKYAVRIGGGQNHRLGLYDQVLIKDNHLEIVHRLTGKDTFAILVSAARLRSKPKTVVEIEVDQARHVREALLAGPDIIMLDNMRPAQMKAAVKLRDRMNRRVRLEASGNVDERTVRAIARSGVDMISVGKLTHSVRSIDISLDITGLS